MNEKFVSTLSAIAGKVQQNELISTISQSLMKLMPVLMIGSIGSLFQQIPFEAYQNFIVSTGLINVFKAMVNVTTNMLAVYVAFSIAYSSATSKGKDGFTAGALSLGSLLLITPMETVGEGYMAVTNLPLTWLGSTGLFTAMIIAFITAKIYCWFIDKDITIKLPDSVPPFIGKSFAGIIPGVAIMTLWAVINVLIGLTPFGNLHQVIYGLIAAPLQNLGGSVWAGLIAKTLTGLCWFLGIHGMAVAMVVAPIWMAGDIANVSAISNGAAPTNIITQNWMESVSNIGGAGCTIGLVLLCLFVAKSKRYKDMGKLTIAPSLFGINEPVTYGMPCMLNPILAIPYIFLPVVFVALSYILVKIGFLPIGNGVGAPAAIPVLSGLVNMGWRGAVWNIVEIVLSVLAYLPFFKILDKQAFEEENGKN